MVTINCTVYEQGDLLKTIEYAKKKKYEDYYNGLIKEKLLELEIETLNRLKDRINGKYVSDYNLNSSKYSPYYESDKNRKED